MGTSRVSPVATSDVIPCSSSAKSSARAKTCLRPTRTVVPLAMSAWPTTGLRQFIEKCDAVTEPTLVAAAKPQAVSSRAAIIPAWRWPEYCVKQSFHFMRISAWPSAAATTSNPAHRLKLAHALVAARYQWSKPAPGFTCGSITAPLVSRKRQRHRGAHPDPAWMYRPRRQRIADGGKAEHDR